MFKKAYTKLLNDLRKLPERKQYIEVFTAILTVPVLLTVIILNVNNLREKDKPKEETTKPVQEIVITQPQEEKEMNTSVTTTPCVEEIGPISIDNPTENEVVSDNPVQVSINYKKGKYCAVVWSYRINGTRWSDYDDNSVALYNLPQGNVEFDLRVKSVVTGEEKMLTRNFVYRGTSTVPTEPVASDSAQ